MNPIVRQIVDRQHVGDSNRDVIRAVHSALKSEGRKKEHRELRKEMYRDAIKRHDENRGLYTKVMTGRF